MDPLGIDPLGTHSENNQKVSVFASQPAALHKGDSRPPASFGCVCISAPARYWRVRLGGSTGGTPIRAVGGKAQAGGPLRRHSARRGAKGRALSEVRVGDVGHEVGALAVGQQLRVHRSRLRRHRDLRLRVELGQQAPLRSTGRIDAPLSAGIRTCDFREPTGRHSDAHTLSSRGRENKLRGGGSIASAKADLIGVEHLCSGEGVALGEAHGRVRQRRRRLQRLRVSCQSQVRAGCLSD